MFGEGLKPIADVFMSPHGGLGEGRLIVTLHGISSPFSGISPEMRTRADTRHKWDGRTMTYLNFCRM
jgi:hypothetical protein